MADAAPRILVVDDDPVVRHLLAHILLTGGYRVEAAASGTEALDLLERRPVDLVISDLRMPGMSGEQLWSTLRIEQPHLAASMLFVSADHARSERCQFVQQIGRPLIQKPFDVPRLLEVVARTCPQAPQPASTLGRSRSGEAP